MNDLGKRSGRQHCQREHRGQTMDPRSYSLDKTTTSGGKKVYIKYLDIGVTVDSTTNIDSLFLATRK